MRSVSTGFLRGAALLTLLVVLAVPTLYAADGNTNTPDARIQPPGGVTSQARIQPPIGTTSQAKIGPPGGVTSQAKIRPPIGPLQLMLRVWLLAKIGPPIG